MSHEGLNIEYKPKLPVNKNRGIAIVGAGEIVRSSHLPAYQMAGYQVVGLYDVDHEKATALAAEFHIPHVYGSLEELLADEKVEIVDIAIQAQFQHELMIQVVQAGRHVLCQKPMAESYEHAVRMEEAARLAGVKAAVNQQMRWSPGINASRYIIKQGWLGELVQATIQVNVMQDFTRWAWLKEIETLEIMYHSIHYIDSIRSVLGTPEYVYADAPRYPNQQTKGESRVMIHMNFGDTLRGLIHDNHNNPMDSSDWFATFRFEGTEGVIKGTNGSLYNYPVGQEDTIAFSSHKLQPDCWITPKLEGKWYPHGFMGSMGELMLAIEEDREPENSLRDNLHTLRVVFASYRSIKENRPVYLSEIGIVEGA